MAALNFPGPPLTVGQQFTTPGGVVYQWDGAAWQTVATPAGGDLAGSTYPNPTIAAAAVTRAKTAADLWLAPIPAGGDVGKVLSVASGPALAWLASPGGPPSGAAGGSLTGSYPNPGLLASALPWTPSGVTLTPTDATKLVAVPGSTSTGEVFRAGTRTIKTRITAHPSADWAVFAVNEAFTAGAGSRVQDDNTKASWFIEMRADTDTWLVARLAPGATTPTQPLSIDNTGKLTCTLANQMVTWPMLALQSYARVRMVTTFPTIPTGTSVTTLTWDTVDSNVGGLFSTGSPDRFTIQQAGVYLWGANCEMNASAAGNYRRLLLFGGPATVIGDGRPGAGITAMHAMELASLAAGTVLTAGVWQDSGAGLALTNYQSNPSFYIARIA